MYIPSGALPLNDFYPRPPRGGRHFLLFNCFQYIKISIHALREEGDVFANLGEQAILKFLSTPSARRATFCDYILSYFLEISIHALREEGDQVSATAAQTTKYFYPRPPRGGRRRIYLKTGSQKDFYPRPPRGGRRSSSPVRLKGDMISIHALREEGDARISSLSLIHSDFYPRPPRGGRPAP